MGMPNYYALLGVPLFYATQDEIRSAYLQQIRYFHPDLKNVTPEIAEFRTKLLNEGYAVLRDVQKKREYDAKLDSYLKSQEQSKKPEQKTPPPKEPVVDPVRKCKDTGYRKTVVVWMTVFAVFAMLWLFASFVDDTSSKQELPDSGTPKIADNASESNDIPQSYVADYKPVYFPEPLPENGEIIDPSYKLYSSKPRGILTIETNGEQNYFVKLRTVNSGALELSFFVRAGMSADVDVPFGEYELSYAAGETWYGPDHLFGEETICSKSDVTFLFEDYGDSVTWWTVELYAQPNGNFETYEIDAQDF